MVVKVSGNPQNFEFIDNYLSNKELKNPDLELLKPGSQLYKTLLFQPCGEIEFGDYFVRNLDTNISKKKFESFFELAIRNNVNLAITPEYSCPWKVIESLVENNIFPQEHNLWIIGCESIKQKELKELMRRYKDIVWIFEEDILQTEEEDMFLDPVCYFFKTRNIRTSLLANVVLVQFKTHPMSGSFERDRLILGKKIYILRNDQDSIYLITLICSDTLIFKMDTLPCELNMTYLVMHIQLNKKPFHDLFSGHRIRYYQLGSKKREFLCLNWARNSIMNRELFSLYGGSALYTKSDEIDLQDERICKNHNLGLYYSHWPPAHAHIFFFNYDEYVFEYKNTKALQEGDTIQNQGNSGPQMKRAYKWNDTNGNGWEEVNHLMDENCVLLCEHCVNYCPLKNTNLTPINKERLIALSTGKAISPNWIKPKNITFFKTVRNNRSNEVNRRLTFLQDPDEEVKSLKRQTMRDFLKLYNIIDSKSSFPEILCDLSKDCLVKYEPNASFESYMYNLYSKNSRAKASVSYIGDETEALANSVFVEMSKLFIDQQPRVVVWYGEANRAKNISGDIPTYKRNTNRPLNSIFKGGELN
ncbi:hypothetical protein FTO70_15570 [Methanosarcina sp. KYL-1]|nr:hypothetical protein [Methanosarcina sp. KYL-1]